MEFLDQIWKFVNEKPAVAGVILTVILAIIAGLWKLSSHFFRKRGPGDGSSGSGGGPSSDGSSGGSGAVKVVVELGDEVSVVVEILLREAKRREDELKAEHRQELADAHGREAELREQYTEAVEPGFPR